MKNVCINNWLKNFLGRPAGGKFCGALESFCRMQNHTKARISLDSAHQEQLIATLTCTYFATSDSLKQSGLVCVFLIAFMCTNPSSLRFEPSWISTCTARKPTPTGSQSSLTSLGGLSGHRRPPPHTLLASGTLLHLPTASAARSIWRFCSERRCNQTQRSRQRCVQQRGL